MYKHSIHNHKPKCKSWTMYALTLLVMLAFTAKVSAYEVETISFELDIPQELSLDNGLRFCEYLDGVYNYKENTCTIRVLTQSK